MAAPSEELDSEDAPLRVAVQDRRRKSRRFEDRQVAHARRLVELGIALSSERDHNRLMERILVEAKLLANADGGTLYLINDRDELEFGIVLNDSLEIALGGSSGRPIPFPPLPLHDPETGQPNFHNVATAVAISGAIIAVEDAYSDPRYDFSGTKKFDSRTGYRSQSFLTLPLRKVNGDVIGVLQLINAQDENGNVVSFDEEAMPTIEAMASQAAVALDNQLLVQAQRDLLDAFIETLAYAIDAKSPYTGGHCQRVPVLTKMLAQAACEAKDGPFRDFDLSENDWYQLHLAAWLHDCGKVTTPEYVMDKATKLETIYNRIHEIRTRFEVLRRDAEIAYLRATMAEPTREAEFRAAFEAEQRRLEEDYAYVAQCNIGSEFMDAAAAERLKAIGAREWTRTFDATLGTSWEERQRYNNQPPPPAPHVERLLDDRPEQMNALFPAGELHNLSIQRGTLNAAERRKINDHIVLTQEMLNQLPFPRHLKDVPEFAGNHHEKMDGTGYPRGLKGSEMSVPARMMAIADVFEALTAADRPYKKAKTLSESVRILSRMAQESHIDAELFQLFLTSGIHLRYGEMFLQEEQMDEVDVSQFLPIAAQ